MEVERRSLRRKKFSLPIFFDPGVTGPTSLKNTSQEGFCIDINDNGLGLLSRYRLKKRQILKLYLPVKGVSRTHLPVLGEVVWTNKEKVDFRGGLRFLA
jgi:hypothetical protein